MLSYMNPQKNTNWSLLPAETLNKTAEGLLLSLEGYAISAIVLFLIGFFGFSLNLIAILLAIKDKELRTPMNTILFNLICSDFSVSVLGNPFTLISAVYHHWIFGRTLCVIYGFFMSLLGMNSITTLAVLSIERYMMISRPFRRHNLTHRGAKNAVGLIWIYAFGLASPPLIGWGDYVSEAADISCSVNWEHKTFSATTYILFLFTFGLIVPVLVISFSYLNIVYTIRKKTLRTSRTSQAESKVALMVGVMILAFLLAWLPYAVLSLIIAFGDSSKITPGLAVIPALVAKSSICYNPIIYAGLNAQFQASWKRTLRWKMNSPRRAEGGELTTLTPSTRHPNFNYSMSPKLATTISTDGSNKYRISLVTLKGQSDPIMEVQEDPQSEVIGVCFEVPQPERDLRDEI